MTLFIRRKPVLNDFLLYYNINHCTTYFMISFILFPLPLCHRYVFFNNTAPANTRLPLVIRLLSKALYSCIVKMQLAVFIWMWYLNKSFHVFPLLCSFSVKCNASQQWSPKVLLLCCSWGACMPRRSQRLCQLQFWLLVGSTMLDRLWRRGQTKCNTPLMLALSVYGLI